MRKYRAAIVFDAVCLEVCRVDIKKLVQGIGTVRDYRYGRLCAVEMSIIAIIGIIVVKTGAAVGRVFKGRGVPLSIRCMHCFGKYAVSKAGRFLCRLRRLALCLQKFAGKGMAGLHFLLERCFW